MIARVRVSGGFGASTGRSAVRDAAPVAASSQRYPDNRARATTTSTDTDAEIAPGSDVKPNAEAP